MAYDCYQDQQDSEWRAALDYVLDSSNPLVAVNRFREHIGLLKTDGFLFFSEVGYEVPETITKDYGSYAIQPPFPRGTKLWMVDYESVMNETTVRRVITDLHFDTQLVTYLRGLQQGKDLSNVTDLDKLLAQLSPEECERGSISLTCLPYLVENSVDRSPEKQTIVWESLKAFYALADYGTNSSVYKEHDVELSVRADEGLKLFLSMNNEWFENNYKVQAYYYIMLLNAAIVKLSEKSRQNEKQRKMLHRCVRDIGRIPERDIPMFIEYFNDNNATRHFFRRLANRPPRSENETQFEKYYQGLLKSINGMAWDLTHLRNSIVLMQQKYLRDPSVIPIDCIVSFDRGLNGMVGFAPLKAVAFTHKGVFPRLRDEEHNTVIRLCDSDALSFGHLQNDSSACNLDEITTKREAELRVIMRGIPE